MESWSPDPLQSLARVTGEVCSTQLLRRLERVREEVGGGQSSLKDVLVSLGCRQTPKQPQTKLKAAKPLGDFLVQVHIQRWTIWTLMPTHRVNSKKPNKRKPHLLNKSWACACACVSSSHSLFFPSRFQPIWMEPPVFRDGPPHSAHWSICQSSLETPS